MGLERGISSVAKVVRCNTLLNLAWNLWLTVMVAKIYCATRH